MTSVPGFEPFKGQHCESSATGNLLKHAGLELSEPLSFGLGEGLAYGVFVFKNAPAPFIGGRPKPEEITQNLARHLGLDIEYRESRSPAKAWQNVASFIDAGQPVAAKIDMYYLDYFHADFHFAGHYVAAHGYDAERVFVVDTDQQGSALSTSRETFEQGRLWKGPMSSNALTWTIAPGDRELDWPGTLRSAMSSNARSYLNPPISNFGAKGIRKTAKIMPTWLQTVENAPVELPLMGSLMEHGGTGGGLFRCMYRDFLAEAGGHLQDPSVSAAHDLFAEAAPLWTEVSERLIAVSDDGQEALDDAAAILRRLADIEERAMTELATL